MLAVMAEIKLQEYELLNEIPQESLVAQQSIKLKYAPGRAIDVPVNILDITRAKQYLDWQPEVRLPEGISSTFYKVRNA